jgi:hypothetical protein
MLQINKIKDHSSNFAKVVLVLLWLEKFFETDPNRQIRVAHLTAVGWTGWTGLGGLDQLGFLDLVWSVLFE